MSLFKSFFIWLEEHQIGILTTIAIHLFAFTTFLMFKISAIPAQEFVVMVDFSQIIFEEDEPAYEDDSAREQNVQEFIESMRQDIRHIPVNVDDQRARESIDRMIREIKAEENIADPPPSPQDVPAPPTEEDAPINTYDDRFPLDAAGGRTIYTGATTVSYELEGRRHTHMPAPVYTCRAGGTIVVDITVNGNGYVVSAQINRSRSNSQDPCLVSNARRDAERSRFNRSNTAQQQGTITYIFQAQ